MVNLFLSRQLGEHHEKTKESSEYLKYLTQQAVALQRTMNEIYKNGSNANIMPLKVTRSTGQRAVPAASCVQPLLRDMDCQEGVAVVPGQVVPSRAEVPARAVAQCGVISVDGAQRCRVPGEAAGCRDSSWGESLAHLHTTLPCCRLTARGRLLNPEVLQFPHPQKCCHLFPGALFSFQGCCGWGGWVRSAEGLSYLTWSRNDWPSWAKPSCSCLPPHLAEHPA